MFPLEKFQHFYLENGSTTKQALSDALRLGLDSEDIEQVVRELRPAHFYKSMPATRVQGAWQDVYKLKYMGIPLYIKIQLLERAKSVITVVIAFKEDESAS
jgi:hypothetical protein